MKRIIGIILTLSLLLSLVSCAGRAEITAPEEPTQEQSEQKMPEVQPKEESGQQAEEQPTEPETAPESPDEPTEPETAPEPPAEELNADSFLEIRTSQEYLSEWDEDRTLAESSWKNIWLSEADAERYPQLENALEEYNADTSTAAYAYHDELVEYAKSDLSNGREFISGYTSEYTAAVQRADTQILSIAECWYTYSGGVHPNSIYSGYNFDPATGRSLSIEDVVRDKEAFLDLLCEKTLAQYADAVFDQETLRAALADYTPWQLQWTMDYVGIRVYFSPYEIASYAAGLLTVDIDFAEAPDLFRQEYISSASSWVKELMDYQDYTIHTPQGDHTISLFNQLDEYELNTLGIKMDGTEIIYDDDYYYTKQQYLVCREGKYYLYFQGTIENDFRYLVVYDLNDGGPVLKGEGRNLGVQTLWGEEEERSYDLLPMDPNCFYMETRLDSLSTYGGVKCYSVGEDGLPVTKDQLYTVRCEWISPLVTITPLEVELADGTKETLPAGSSLAILRTDGESFIEAALEDGRECRVYYEETENGKMINGMYEYDVFEVLYYAG